MNNFITTLDTAGNAIDTAITATFDATASVASRIGSRIKSISPMRTVAVGAVALTAFLALPNATSAASINDEDSITTQTDDFFTASEEPDTVDISPEQKAVDAAVASVSKKLQDAGASKESADVVSNREAKIFFGADRAEITKVEADGVCIVTTHEGKTLREFTKTTLSPQNTAAEAQLIMIDALCDNEGGVNVPAVATVMAKIEAMRNDIDINAEFSKVYGEISQKYIEAMQGNPQVADAFLKDAQKFLKDAEFGQPYDISGRTDLSVYVGNDGIINSLVVTNKAGATAVPVMWILNSGGNAEPKKQPQDEKACAQPTVVEEAPTPVVETPTPERTPEPEVFKGKARACVGLNDDGTPNYKFFYAIGNDQDEANRNAQAVASLIEESSDCEADEITTTTTTTTTPATTTTSPNTTTTTTAPTTTSTTTSTTTTSTTPTTGPTTAPTTAPEEVRHRIALCIGITNDNVKIFTYFEGEAPTLAEAVAEAEAEKAEYLRLNPNTTCAQKDATDPTVTQIPVSITSVPVTGPDTTADSMPDATVDPGSGAEASQGEGGGPILASATPLTVPERIFEAAKGVVNPNNPRTVISTAVFGLGIVAASILKKKKKLGQAS